MKRRSFGQTSSSGGADQQHHQQQQQQQQQQPEQRQPLLLRDTSAATAMTPPPANSTAANSAATHAANAGDNIPTHPKGDTHGTPRKAMLLTAFLDAFGRYALIAIGPDLSHHELSLSPLGSSSGGGDVTAPARVPSEGSSAPANANGTAWDHHGRMMHVLLRSADRYHNSSLFAGPEGSSREDDDDRTAAPFLAINPHARMLLCYLLGSYLGVSLAYLSHRRASNNNSSSNGSKGHVKWFGRIVGCALGLHLLLLGRSHLRESEVMMLACRFLCGALVGALRRVLPSKDGIVATASCEGIDAQNADDTKGKKGKEGKEGRDVVTSSTSRPHSPPTGMANEAEWKRSQMQSYALGALVAIASSFGLHIVCRRYRLERWVDGILLYPPTTGMFGASIRIVGYWAVVAMIGERVVGRYYFRISNSVTALGEEARGRAGGPGGSGGGGAGGGRTPRVLKSALRKVSGCRRRKGGSKRISIAESESEQEQELGNLVATDANVTGGEIMDGSGGNGTADVEMGVTFEAGQTPPPTSRQQQQQQQSSSLDLSQVYHTPHQHYLPGGGSNYYDGQSGGGGGSSGGSSIPSSPNSAVTLKMSGSAPTPLFHNEPLMQSPLLTPAMNTNRSRANSANSAFSSRSDIFYDAMSEEHSGGALTEEEFLAGLSSSSTLDNQDQGAALAMYHDGTVIYPNGEPAHVPPQHCRAMVPQTYVDAFGEGPSAHSKWEETQKWRRTQHVWKIHRSPHVHFDAIKKAYPHFAHGFSKKGYIVVYEQPGKMELKGLFRSGCTVDDMIHHYTYLMEYQANVLSQDPSIMEARRRYCWEQGLSELEPWGSMVVMDVSGAGPSSLSGDVLRYLKRAGDTNAAHYPLTMRRAFVVNSPFWLSGIFSTVRSILPASVQVELLGGKTQIKYLTEHIDIDQIPETYGGKSRYSLGQHPFETKLKKMVQDGNTRDAESGGFGTLSKDDGGIPPLVTLGSSENTSATPSIDGNDDDDDGNFVDVPFGTPAHTNKSHPMQRLSRRGCANTSAAASKIENFDFSDSEKSQKSEATKIKTKTALLVGALHFMTLSCQAILETSLSLWMICPQTFQGLDYDQGTRTIVYTATALLLLWRCASLSNLGVALVGGPARVGRSNSSIFHPLRRLRIGAGSTACFVVLLPLAVKSVPKHEDFLILTLTCLILCCLVVAVAIARSSSRQIVDIVSSQLPTQRRSLVLSGFAGEIFGCIASVYIFCHFAETTAHDTTSVFTVVSLIFLISYALSFCIATGPSGDFALLATPTKKQHSVAAIAVGDVASVLRLVRESFRGY